MKNITKLQYAGIIMLLFVTIATPVFASQTRAEQRSTRSEARQEHIQSRFSETVERIEAVTTRHEVNENHDDENENNDEGNDHGHNPGMIEAVAPIPTIDLIVHNDPKAGYNLEIITTNYTFTPENASTPHVNGEGHAHIYVDGEKLTRIYGNWFYLPSLEPGEHTVRVELSANNHSAYAHDGVKIDDTEIITVN